MNPQKENLTIEEKLEDTAFDGAAIPFDPDEAEELGATPDDMPELEYQTSEDRRQ